MKAKKLLKVLLSFALATTCISGSMVTTHAASYDPCDVNRDGVVNVADVTALSSYLKGKYYAPNYSQFDVNHSLTVDYADVLCISAKVTGGSYSSSYYSRATKKNVPYPTTSGFIPDSAASLTTSRTYMRYSYATNKQLTNYTLTPSTKALTASSVSPMEVVGNEDSRYLATGAENNGIVKLSCSVGGSTGFIVGDHQIATAAHCVYDKDNSKWGTSMKVTLYNTNGTISTTTFTPVETHIPSLYKTSSDSTYDYALITVKENLSKYTHFDLGSSYNVTASNFSTIPIYVTGCPGQVGSVDNSTPKRLYSAEGHVMYNDNTSILYYDVDATSGQSGSPVYTITRINNSGTIVYVYTALSIHSRGNTTRNNGPLITKYHQQFYKDNPNISY